MKPKRGALAICGAGTLGIITSREPVPVTYDNGTLKKEWLAWTGIHLTDTQVKGHLVTIGDPWSARTPKIIGYLT